MCDECLGINRQVILVRQWPKRKATSPATWLEYDQERRGHFEEIDRSGVGATDEYEVGSANNPIVGYYTEYGGAREREYSQPMFVLKTVGADGCYRCENPTLTEQQREELQVWHPADREGAHKGCECGNLAVLKDCPEHPAPSADSRWVRMQVYPGTKCAWSGCNRPVPQEVWHPGALWFCNRTCKDESEAERKKRDAEWKAKYNRS